MAANATLINARGGNVGTQERAGRNIVSNVSRVGPLGVRFPSGQEGINPGRGRVAGGSENPDQGDFPTFNLPELLIEASVSQETGLGVVTKTKFPGFEASLEMLATTGPQLLGSTREGLALNQTATLALKGAFQFGPFFLKGGYEIAETRPLSESPLFQGFTLDPEHPLILAVTRLISGDFDGTFDYGIIKNFDAQVKFRQKVVAGFGLGFAATVNP